MICLSPLKRTTADGIASTLIDALQLMQFKLGDARGQCYDGAATLSGKKKGVATQIKSMHGKCLFNHCYGYTLNLAIGKGKLNENEKKGIRTLCPTSTPTSFIVLSPV